MRSKVGSLGLELITRRSQVRILAPLPDNTVVRQTTVFLLAWRTQVPETRVYPVSYVCDENGLQPTVLYRWQGESESGLTR